MNAAVAYNTDKTNKELILEGLNSAQQEVVINYRGMSICTAGPGSGKTHTVVARAQWMIEDGVDPNKMLLFTFTKDGANEMKERIMSKLGEKAKGMTVTTYHSFCCRMLRKYIEVLGIWTRDFSIFDNEDQAGVLKDCLEKYRRSHPNMLKDKKGKDLIREISYFKDRMISPTLAKQQAEDDWSQAIADIYEMYALKMQEENAIDFDDMIYLMIRVFEASDQVLDSINKKYVYITADEFQDSSERDLQLIDYLSGANQELCCVMDDEQAIYSFRGANIMAVYDFIESHNMKQYQLGQNYRSTGNIVRAARSMVVHNENRLEKTVFTENDEGDDVLYYSCQDQEAEANKVMRTVKACKRAGFNYGDIAVLYRMSYLSRPVEEALLHQGIPYEVVSGSPFYARKEVKDILAYLRFIVNKSDEEAFKRCVNTPKRGVGDATIQKLMNTDVGANFNKNSLQTVDICDTMSLSKGRANILDNIERVGIKGKAKKGLENFKSVIETLESTHIHKQGKRENDNKTSSVGDIINDIVTLTKYFDYLTEDDKETAEDRIKNVLELQNIASGYADISEFLEKMVVDVSEQTDDGQEADKVHLLTMHASKGMEFPVVIIIGAVEGISPHFRSINDGLIEEERRLFYVAMTRAEQELVITRPKYMLRAGSPTFCSESRFIKEINKNYLSRL